MRYTLILNSQQLLPNCLPKIVFQDIIQILVLKRLNSFTQFKYIEVRLGNTDISGYPEEQLTEYDNPMVGCTTDGIEENTHLFNLPEPMSGRYLTNHQTYQPHYLGVDEVHVFK